MATTAAPLVSSNVTEAQRSKSVILQSHLAGMLWFGGWLFTLGFLQLGFWKAVLGLLLWPYFLGDVAR